MSQDAALARSPYMPRTLPLAHLALAALAALTACHDLESADPLCACGASAPRGGGGAAATCEAASERPGTGAVLAPRVEPWPEAERIFRDDPRWLGAGGARSVALEGDRVLWLFAESLVATGASLQRRDAVVIHNQVSIQHGRDPLTATMQHVLALDGVAPRSFLADEGAAYYWPGGAIRVHEQLLLTFVRIRPAQGGLGFEVDGHRAVRVEDTRASPETWALHDVRLPPASTGVTFTGHLLACDGFVLAYGFAEPRQTIYLARWPEQRVAEGDLGAPEWWTGDAWSRDVAARAPVMAGGQTELSVSQLSGRAGFFVLQAQGFGAVPLVVRSGEAPTGPFLAPVEVYSPKERGREGLLVHGAITHPALSAGDAGLAATYVVTAVDRERVLTDASLHTPRMLRLVP